MKILSIAAIGLLCVLSVGYGLPAKNDQRIIGGSQAKPNQFPYMVSIQDRTTRRHYCGGAIIGPRWVITGHQCLRHAHTKDFVVVAGTNRREDFYSRDTQVILVSHFYTPSKFDSESRLPYSDIALVYLKSPFTYNAAIQPVALPGANEGRAGDMVLSGWGSVDKIAYAPAQFLQYIEMPSISNEECNDLLSKSTSSFKYLVKDMLLCTLPSEEETACLDFGSPLVQGGVLVGIATWEYRGCQEGVPNVFTKVSAFREFIDEIVSPTENNCDTLLTAS